MRNRQHEIAQRDWDKAIDPKTYVFDFGQHRGKSYQDLLWSGVALIEDIQYVLWAHEKVDKFTLPEEEMIKLKERLSAYRNKQSMKKDWARSCR